MTEQRIWDEARETAAVLFEDRGYREARRWVIAALKTDTSKSSFWCRVSAELEKFR